MRLPWWPIYLDARFDEYGVYYASDDEPEQLVPWHRVKWSCQNSNLLFTIWDDQGNVVSDGCIRIFLRVKRKIDSEAATKASTFQKAYLESTENKYVCAIDQQRWRKDQAAGRFISFIASILLPVLFLGMMFHGLRTVPENEAGTRYQNGILVLMGMIVFAAIYTNWRVLKGYRFMRRTPKAIEVNQLGILATDSQGESEHFAWSSLVRIRYGYGHIVVTTDTGQGIVLPQAGCAIQIVRARVKSAPEFGLKFFMFLFIGSILAGPFSWAWFSYLLPEQDIPSRFLWGPSLMSLWTVFMLYGLAQLEPWLTKRRGSKSQ